MQTKRPVFVSSSGKQIFRRATARESLLSIVVAWINIYLRNAYTDNSRKRIIGVACLNGNGSRYYG